MKRFAVIGLGNFGYYTAKALYEDGNEVVAIDMDKDKVQSVSSCSTEAVVLNATDKETLKSLGLDEMDGVIVSTGMNMSISILICSHLYEIGVKRILAKVLDEDHGKILEKIGVSDIIFPERDMAYRIARTLSKPNILDFIPLSDAYSLVQIEPPKEFIGKSIQELNLRAKYGVHIVAIKEDGPEDFILIPTPDYIISEKSIMILLGTSADLKKVKPINRMLA